MNNRGILLLGHGTPSAEGTRSFLEFVKLAESLAGDTPVAAGFMEFAAPTIAQGMADLYHRGARRVAAVPVFLSGAGHTAEDIPPAVTALRLIFKDAIIDLTPHVGSHPNVAELSALRYKEAIAGRAEIPAEATLAVIAAHGSPEPEAFAELERFAAARQKIMPVGRTVPCFSQLGVPQLKRVLPTLIEPRFRRIVVQPHFLLKGRLVESIAETVAAVARQYPEIDWVVAEPLGSHPLLAEAVLELAGNVSEPPAYWYSG